MNLKEYARAVQGGDIAVAVQGLCGRIIRGKKPEDFLTLTDDPLRELVLLMGPDGLASLCGKSGYEMLVEIGYQPDYIVRKVRDEGCRFKLIVFPEGGPAKLATWDNVIDVVADVYPDVARKLARHRETLKVTPFVAIATQAGFDFSAVDKAGPTDPRYMTHDRYRTAPGTLANARAFLYFTIHLRELFSGDGYTYTADGRRGLQEFIVPNLPIDRLGEHLLLDLTVDLGSATKGTSMKTTTQTTGLPLPAFYDPQHAEDWSYNPDLAALFTEATAWRATHGITPSATDQATVHLLLIDMQKDFCFPRGTLYVGGRSGRGAMDDSKRTAEFIYRNLRRITKSTRTFDTHFAYQIFFATLWETEDGKPLSGHTLIDVDDQGRLVNLDLAGTVIHANVRPRAELAWWLCNGNYPFLLNQVRHYCAELKKGGKYTLYLWPPHCILGSEGHALVGTVLEASMFLSYVRGCQSDAEVKGGHPLTENYSVLGAEVLTRFDGKPLAQRNSRFIETLLTSDAVVIAGQASSHCVKSTIDDLLAEILTKDPALARKVYILRDCMSAVAVPDGKGGFAADFTPQADDALRKFEAAGMHVVNSTDPIETWPGMDTILS